MKLQFLQLISRFTDRKIPAGVGVTTDDTVVLSTPISQNQVEKAQRVGKMTYVLRSPSDVGGFEMIGFVKQDNATKYRLRHTLTDTTFDITKAHLELIFEKASH